MRNSSKKVDRLVFQFWTCESSDYGYSKNLSNCSIFQYQPLTFVIKPFERHRITPQASDVSDSIETTNILVLEENLLFAKVPAVFVK